MMIMISRSILFLWLVGLGFFPLFGGSLGAKEIPAAEVKILEEALSSARNEDGSAARKRLAVKRVVRDAGKLLESHGDAKNRYEVLAVLFKSKQLLFGMDNAWELAPTLMRLPAWKLTCHDANRIGSQVSESS